MASYLREIESERWEGDLPQGDQFPADPLFNLRTDKNELSIWKIDADERILDIAAARSYKSARANGFDFILFDEGILTGLGLEFKLHKGGTGFKELDRSYHFDVVNLTANKLCELARSLKESGQIDAKIPKAVAKRIKNLHDSGILIQEMGPGWQKLVAEIKD